MDNLTTLKKGAVVSVFICPTEASLKSVMTFSRMQSWRTETAKFFTHSKRSTERIDVSICNNGEMKGKQNVKSCILNWTWKLWKEFMVKSESTG